MHEGISYIDDLEIYYYHCHSDGSEWELVKNKWYKITCLLKLNGLPLHKNIYFVPQRKLEEFLKYNPETLVDIEPITQSEVEKMIWKQD
jgi:hypothetical protein